jgi:plasmid maintenance system antidote protein VapI
VITAVRSNPMPTTMQLLDKALSIEPSASEWCRKLGVTRSAIAVAKTRGRLSPTLAGSLASQLGEDPKEWITVAAMEAEPESPAKKALIRALNLAKL